jgi:hypothetical protein
MFTMGMLFPKANSKVESGTYIANSKNWDFFRLKGAFYGAIGGLIFISALVIPAKYYESQGLFKYPPKPLSTNSCDFLNHSVLPNSSFFESSNPVFESTTPVYAWNETVT